MANFVIGVVVDILIHIFVENREGFCIEWVSSYETRELGILNTSKLLVLKPQICLDDFGCGEETQDGGITACEAAAAVVVSRISSGR